jgi:hypothetical protein
VTWEIREDVNGMASKDEKTAETKAAENVQADPTRDPNVPLDERIATAQEQGFVGYDAAALQEGDTAERLGLTAPAPVIQGTANLDLPGGHPSDPTTPNTAGAGA